MSGRKSTHTQAACPLRVFVGFSEADQKIKERFLKHLAIAERIGAIDVWSQDHITAGSAWREEMSRAVDAADTALLLLSPDFLAASWSQEVLLPRLLARRQQDGLQIFLVLIRSCTWDLDPALRQLPFWPRTVAAIGGLTARQQDEVFSQIAREIAALGSRRRLIHPPDGPYMPAMYVHRPQEEKYALNRLKSHGLPVVLQGPQSYGKASLLSHLLHQVQSEFASAHRIEPQIVRIRLSGLDSTCFKSLDLLLRQIANQIVQLFYRENTEAWVSGAWRRSGSETHKLTSVLRSILSQSGQLFLAIEEADRVWGLPFQDDFFACLRSWVDRQDDPWTKLRLIVTVSMEPVVLENADHSSFFAHANPIRLHDFTRSQIGQLALLYGVAPDNPSLDEMVKLVGGHPYLARLALAEASLREVMLGELLAKHDCVDGVFTPHLLRHRYWLERHDLMGVLGCVLFNPSFRPSLAEYCQLYSQGLMVEHGQVGAYRLRCRLYQDYFQALCKT